MNLFDETRRSWVKAAPEERVRQMWLHHLIHSLHFPKELIVVEKSLRELPSINAHCAPDRRIDILCYAKGDPLSPLLLMECKRGKVDRSAIDQVVGYNAFVRAPFIAVAGKEEISFGYWDGKEKKYIFGGMLPSYEELVTWAKQS